MTVLVVGEALVDVLPHGTGTLVRPGGGPANIAVGLGRLGHDVTLLTSLGDDAHGALVRDHLEASGVRLLVAPHDHTSVAQAQLDEHGVATYDFDIAWDTRGLAPTAPPRWLHVGSLGATLEPGATQVAELVTRYGEQSVVSYDPNVRPLLMGDADRDRVLGLAARAHVVKLSDEDAAWLCPGARPEEVARQLLEKGPRLVVVTCGGEGALAVVGDHGERVAAAPGGPVVDTVGAGDAFMAGLIDGLLGRDLDPVTVRAALARAAVVARRTCERVGADPPWKDELTTLPDPTPEPGHRGRE